MKFVARVTFGDYTSSYLVNADNTGQVYNHFGKHVNVKKIEIDGVHDEITLPTAETEIKDVTFTDVLKEMKDKTVETATKIAQHPITQEVKEVGQMLVEEMGTMAEEIRKSAMRLKDAIVNYPKNPPQE
jgi:hypothetical protein